MSLIYQIQYTAPKELALSWFKDLPQQYKCFAISNNQNDTRNFYSWEITEQSDPNISASVEASPSDSDNTIWNLRLLWCDDRFETNAFKNSVFRAVQMIFYKKRYQGRHYVLGSVVRKIFIENGAKEINTC